jgi:Protein of unknown function (DUF3383)
MSATAGSLNLGLSPNDIATITVSLSAAAAGARNFGSFIFVGDSGVIDTNSRFRFYTSIEEVGNDFPTNSPEFLAAEIYFDQTPTPTGLYIGAWARTATAATLIGGVLGDEEQLLSNFTSVANGGLSIDINGAEVTATGVNLTGVTSLPGVAAALQAALGGAITVLWNANNGFFEIKSGTVGIASTIAFATPPANGTDLSALMELNAAGGGFVVNGIAAETPLTAATILRSITNNWYGLVFTASVAPQDSDYVAVGQFIQGASTTSIFGVSTQEAGVLSAQSTTDIGSLLQAAGFSRVFYQYSSSSPFAVADIPGLVSTINFLGEDTLYTLKFMQPSGIDAETLTETQAAALSAKGGNVLVNYAITEASDGASQTALLQQGTMANGQFFDVIHGTDWLQNFVQTGIINLFLAAGAAKSKIPQTDSGAHRVKTNITQSLQQGVTNGLIGPGGVWQGPSFGAIKTGQTLSAGFYVFMPSLASQSAAARGARQTPVGQAAIVLAGAFHSASVLLSVMP